MNNEYPISTIRLINNDINNHILNYKSLINEHKTNLFFSISFIIGIFIMISLFFMNSSIASKLSSLELDIKEIEINHQRDQTELNPIEQQLSISIKEKSELNDKHIMLIDHFKKISEVYKARKNEYDSLKKEVDSLNAREKDINAQIRGYRLENIKIIQNRSKARKEYSP